MFADVVDRADEVDHHAGNDDAERFVGVPEDLMELREATRRRMATTNARHIAAPPMTGSRTVVDAELAGMVDRAEAQRDAGGPGRSRDRTRSAR